MRVCDLTGFQNIDSLGPTSIDIEYITKGIDGNILSSEMESVVVDGQAQFTKTLILPEDIEEGDYFFSVVVRYKTSVGTSSHLVSITKPSIEKKSSLGVLDNNLIIILAFVVVFFLGIIFLFIYLIHDRDKLLLELRRHNSLELERQRKFLMDQEKLIRNKRPITKIIIKKEVREKIKTLKVKHKIRIKEFRRLKKKGDIKTMQRKLRQWKKEGYNSLALDSKLKDLDVGDMKGIMKEWKKKGYTK